MGRIAVLSDIHGNIWALEAVLADAARQGCGELLNLGDAFYGPLAPGATARRLSALPNLRSIRGNQDRLLLEARLKSGPAGNPTLAYVLSELGVAAWNWLESLPGERLAAGEWLCCHGTPWDDAAYLIEDVSTGRPVPRGARTLLSMLGGAPGTHVLCGHSHLPRGTGAGGRLLVNPGSVGLPAYADDDPPHVMETGSPHARYAIVERTDQGYDVSLRCVAYDVQAAVSAAKERGREDWAVWLAEGFASGAG